MEEVGGGPCVGASEAVGPRNDLRIVNFWGKEQRVGLSALFVRAFLYFSSLTY